MIVLAALMRLLFLHALPKRVFPLLWLAALARLLVPFPAALSLPVPAPAAVTEEAFAPLYPIVTPEPQDITYVPRGGAAAGAERAPGLPAYQIVYLAGVAAAAMGFAVLYAVQYRRFRYAEAVTNDESRRWLHTHRLRRTLSLKTLDTIASPLTYGVFRPVILVPKTLDWESAEAGFALEHEYIHARRFHAAYKLLLAAALTVHWCNPAVWLLYFLANRDLELSCDEAVLRRFGGDRRGDYARALLSMEEKRGRFPALSAGFGANTAKERILSIMKYKKSSAVSILLAALLVAAAAACSIVTPTPVESPSAPQDNTPAPAANSPAPSPSVGGARLNGGLTFTVPEEFADMILLDTPDDGGEYGTLFSVTDRRSVEDTQRLYPEQSYEGDGWVFAIGRVSEEKLYDLLCADMSGCGVFARDGDGQYYLYLHPTDVRYSRFYDDEEESRKGLEEWGALNEWGKEMQADFISDNGLTPYRRTNTLADIYLARVASWPDMDVTIQYADKEAFPARGVPGADMYADALARDVVFEGADPSELPQEPPIVMTFPEGDKLVFWEGTNLVRVEYAYGDVLMLFKAAYADPSTVAGDIAAAWLAAASDETR